MIDCMSSFFLKGEAKRENHKMISRQRVWVQTIFTTVVVGAMTMGVMFMRITGKDMFVKEPPPYIHVFPLSIVLAYVICLIAQLFLIACLPTSTGGTLVPLSQAWLGHVHALIVYGCLWPVFLFVMYMIVSRFSLFMYLELAYIDKAGVIVQRKISEMHRDHLNAPLQRPLEEDEIEDIERENPAEAAFEREYRTRNLQQYIRVHDEYSTQQVVAVMDDMDQDDFILKFFRLYTYYGDDSRHGRTVVLTLNDARDIARTVFSQIGPCFVLLFVLTFGVLISSTFIFFPERTR